MAGCGNGLTCRIWDDNFGVNEDLRERKVERVAKEEEVIVEWRWWWVGIEDGELLVQAGDNKQK
jgi:hypothetical protein